MNDAVQELEAAIAEADTDEVLGRDVACLLCNYNLRGLATSGKCPECGAPVDYSLHGNELRYAQPHWLRVVLRGLWVIGLAPPIYAALLIFLIITDGVGMFDETENTVVLLTAAFVVVLCAGVWLLTEKEPGEQTQPTTWNRTARISSVIAQVAAPIYLVTFHMGGVPIIEAPENVTIISGAVMLLSLPVALFSTVGHLATFARRLPDAALARSTAGMTAILIGDSVAWVLTFVMDWHGFIVWNAMLTLATLVFIYWVYMLLWMYIRGIGHASSRANIAALVVEYRIRRQQLAPPAE